MPAAPLRYCLETGCETQVTGGRCVEHDRSRDQARGSARERGYTSRWERFRLWFIRELIRLRVPRAGLCGARLPGARETQSSLCAQQGLVVAGAHVDHIEPHHGDERLLFDPLNLELLCASCHSRVTTLYDQRGRRKP